MSFFVLFNKKRFSNVSERFRNNISEKGFPKSIDIDLGRRRLTLFCDQSGNLPPLHKAGNGDFITAIGSFIYRGQAGVSGLSRFLGNFDIESFDWEGLIGTHVIILSKAGELYILADGLGACKVYTHDDGNIWSNSFLAMCEFTAPAVFDIQACYEYVINGSTFGCRTLVREITALPANSILVVDDEAKNIQLDNPIKNVILPNLASLDQITAYHCEQLDKVFGSLAEMYGNSIRLSFSGGYDSRLLLAMLLRHGVKPDLFVYGHENTEDVRIARTICNAENLKLHCINKDAAPKIELDSMPEVSEQNLYAFDGWRVEFGLFDFGADRNDRLARHLNGQVPLNGSLGEIYRNFFYRPDRPTSTEAVISTFYSPYDPSMFTAVFIEADYRSAMAASMREAIGADSNSLRRFQMEELYPKFRGRFWTGRDAQINQRFGTMFFPYLEHSVISNTAKIPMNYKDLGYLQGRMIAHANSRLAEYPSDYGFPLNGKRPLKYRLKTFLDTQRPPLTRKLAFRLKHRKKEPREEALSTLYLSRVIDTEFPIMRNLFEADHVNTTRQFGLIAALEYLGERYNLRVPSQ